MAKALSDIGLSKPPFSAASLCYGLWFLTLDCLCVCFDFLTGCIVFYFVCIGFKVAFLSAPCGLCWLLGGFLSWWGCRYFFVPTVTLVSFGGTIYCVLSPLSLPDMEYDTVFQPFLSFTSLVQQSA